MANRAAAGELVFDLNFDLRVRTATWNVDLVLGRPATPDIPVTLISKHPPATVEIAIEIKSVMTEHRKAVKNRKRDLEAHHEHVHHYSEKAIAAGVLVVNHSRTFLSPLRAMLTVHAQDNRGASTLVTHCINELRNVEERTELGSTGLDAKCAIVVDMDNVTLPATAYVERPPAPQPGDPLHYDSFIQRLCGLYTGRFP